MMTNKPVTIEQIKKLRAEMGATPADAKKSLVQADGDFEKAKEILKELGHLTAKKKSDREANDGVVALKSSPEFGIILELNCETDFVAQNTIFQNLANLILDAAYNHKVKTVEELLSIHLNNGDTVENEISRGIATLKENIILSKLLLVESGHQEVISGYIHNKYSDNLGKIGVLSVLKCDSENKEKIVEVGRKIAIQVVASSPLAISINDLDQKLIAEQKAKFQDDLSGKPENIVQKIMDGKLAKYYKEVVLLEQDFIMDDEKSVGQFLQEEGKSLGTDISVVKYNVITLGE